MTIENADSTQEEEEQVSAATEEQVEGIEEEKPETDWEAAYKGLQRRHERVTNRVKELEKQPPPQPAPQYGAVDPFVAQAQQMAVPTYQQSLAEGMTQEQATRAYNLAVQANYAALQYQALQQETTRERQEREAEKGALDLEQEMRQMAAEEGVDPNDLDLDYGDRRSPDAATKMRYFRQSLRDVKAKVAALAPAAARKPPNREAARVERSESTSTVGKVDVDAKVRAFEKLNDDILQGRVTDRGRYERLKQLKDEAIAAGAVF